MKSKLKFSVKKADATEEVVLGGSNKGVSLDYLQSLIKVLGISTLAEAQSFYEENKQGNETLVDTLYRFAKYKNATEEMQLMPKFSQEAHKFLQEYPYWSEVIAKYEERYITADNQQLSSSRLFQNDLAEFEYVMDAEDGGEEETSQYMVETSFYHRTDLEELRVSYQEIDSKLAVKCWGYFRKEVSGLVRIPDEDDDGNQRRWEPDEDRWKEQQLTCSRDFEITYTISSAHPDDLDELTVISGRTGDFDVEF